MGFFRHGSTTPSSTHPVEQRGKRKNKGNAPTGNENRVKKGLRPEKKPAIATEQRSSALGGVRAKESDHRDENDIRHSIIEPEPVTAPPPLPPLLLPPPSPPSSLSPPHASTEIVDCRAKVESKPLAGVGFAEEIVRGGDDFRNRGVDCDGENYGDGRVAAGNENNSIGRSTEGNVRPKGVSGASDLFSSLWGSENNEDPRSKESQVAAEGGEARSNLMIDSGFSPSTLLHAQPNPALSILAHLQMWIGGGFNFCATPTAESAQGNNCNTDKTVSGKVVEAGKGEMSEMAPAISCSSSPNAPMDRREYYPVQTPETGKVSRSADDDKEKLSGIGDQAAKTVKRRNGAFRAEYQEEIFPPSCDGDITGSIEDERTNAGEEEARKGSNVQPWLLPAHENHKNERYGVPIAIVEEGYVGNAHDEDVLGQDAIHLATAMRDPALLTGSHYLGWDGRRSHYTVLSDQLTLEEEISFHTSQMYSTPTSAGTAKEGKKCPMAKDSGVSSPYWQSPEAQQHLGGAVAVVHVNRANSPPRKICTMSSLKHQNYGTEIESSIRSRNETNRNGQHGRSYSVDISGASGDDDGFASVFDDSSATSFDPPSSPQENRIIKEFLMSSSEEDGEDLVMVDIPPNSVANAESNAWGGARQKSSWSSPLVKSRNHLKGRPPLAARRMSPPSFPPPGHYTLPNRPRTNTGNSELTAGTLGTIKTAGTSKTKSTNGSLHRRLNSETDFFSPGTLHSICTLDGGSNKDGSTQSQFLDHVGKAAVVDAPLPELFFISTPTVVTSIQQVNLKSKDTSEVSPIDDDFSPITKYKWKQRGDDINANLFGLVRGSNTSGSQDPSEDERREPPEKSNPKTVLRTGLRGNDRKHPANHSMMSRLPLLKKQKNSMKGSQRKIAIDKGGKEGALPQDFSCELDNNGAELYLPHSSSIYRDKLQRLGHCGRCRLEGWVAFSKGDRLVRSLSDGHSHTNLCRDDFRYLVVLDDEPVLHMFGPSDKSGKDEGRKKAKRSRAISLDLRKTTIESKLISKKHGRCIMVFDDLTSMPVCTILPTMLRPCFFSDTSRSRLVNQKKFVKISETLFVPPLREELQWLVEGKTEKYSSSHFPNQQDVSLAATRSEHRRKNSEWGDPDHLLEFAPPGQLAASMHVLFALDSAVKTSSRAHR